MKLKRIAPGHYEGPYGITIKRCEVRKIGMTNKPVKADSWWAVRHDYIPRRFSYTTVGAPTFKGARELADKLIRDLSDGGLSRFLQKLPPMSRRVLHWLLCHGWRNSDSCSVAQIAEGLGCQQSRVNGTLGTLYWTRIVTWKESHRPRHQPRVLQMDDRVNGFNKLALDIYRDNLINTEPCPI